MSKTYQNISKINRGYYDLWSRRPLSRTPLSWWSKRTSRKLERRVVKRRIIAKEIEFFCSEQEG